MTLSYPFPGRKLSRVAAADDRSAMAKTGPHKPLGNIRGNGETRQAGRNLLLFHGLGSIHLNLVLSGTLVDEKQRLEETLRRTDPIKLPP